ncbi:MAG: hypothetical protein Q8J65_01840 [Nitrosomonadales bacterium]|nr:hypothetical protein [Nitrosomonadales bacterium]
MDLVQRRRAVYTGMRPFFNDLELSDALATWEREFSQKPTFALNVFIARCCTTPELKEKRGEILRAVIYAMDLPLSRLLPDPQKQLRSEAQLKADAQYELDNVTASFVALLMGMLAKYDFPTQSGIRNFVVENMSKVNLDERNAQRMREWLSGQSTHLAANYKIDVLQKLVNMAYVAMCEYAGPVKADQLLAQALKEVEPEAKKRKINLRDFL